MGNNYKIKEAENIYLPKWMKIFLMVHFDHPKTRLHLLTDASLISIVNYYDDFKKLGLIKSEKEGRRIYHQYTKKGLKARENLVNMLTSLGVIEEFENG